MALTKVGKEGITGISNSSNANAITIDSSEKVLIGNTSDGDTTGLSVMKAGGGNFIAHFRNTTVGTPYGVKISAPSGDTSGYPLLYIGDHASEEYFKVQNNGIVTKPLQPAFQVTKNATQSDIAEGANVTVTFETEVFDQNANFASNTFTAPVTGRYQLNGEVRLQDLDVDAHYIYLYIVTSNRNYQNIITLSSYDEDIEYLSLPFACLADMDASDTAYLRLYLEGSGDVQVDVYQYNTIFSGFLAC